MNRTDYIERLTLNAQGVRERAMAILSFGDREPCLRENLKDIVGEIDMNLIRYGMDILNRDEESCLADYE